MAAVDKSSATIRTAVLSDIDRIAAIEREVMSPAIYPAFFFRQALSIFGDGFLVAMLNGRPCGYLIIGQHNGDASIAEIYSVAVSSESRGAGLGRALLDAAFVWAKSRDVKTITLTVSPENAPAIGLYKSIGFREIERDEDYYGPGEARYILTAVV
ncbi:GNAT family N-acetyltransferase [Hyphococcus lacteus]|uniref:GNAT family N-acetyltransferase n=1 Tax=Hyphococcus lacteus TaxID=3143536 RepID=A0ABV3Z7A5_9PROT